MRAPSRPFPSPKFLRRAARNNDTSDEKLRGLTCLEKVSTIFYNFCLIVVVGLTVWQVIEYVHAEASKVEAEYRTEKLDRTMTYLRDLSQGEVAKKVSALQDAVLQTLPPRTPEQQIQEARLVDRTGVIDARDTHGPTVQLFLNQDYGNHTEVSPIAQSEPQEASYAPATSSNRDRSIDKDFHERRRNLYEVVAYFGVLQACAEMALCDQAQLLLFAGPTAEALWGVFGGAIILERKNDNAAVQPWFAASLEQAYLAYSYCEELPTQRLVPRPSFINRFKQELTSVDASCENADEVYRVKTREGCLCTFPWPGRIDNYYSVIDAWEVELDPWFPTPSLTPTEAEGAG
ncbi:MAG: hypothetical protein AAFY02_07435 [Pseudomonadota bacterium]